MDRSRQNNELIGNSQGFTLGDEIQKKWEKRDRTGRAVREEEGEEGKGVTVEEKQMQE